MATSDNLSNRNKRIGEESDSAPMSKRHESTSAISNEIRIVPLSSNLAGLSITEPANFVACIIPKSLITVFEKVLRETLERGFATSATLTADNLDNPNLDSDIEGSEFIHDFEDTKENLTKKLYDLPDRELKNEVPAGKFNTFKEYRRKLTKWYVTGQHLVKSLTSPSETRKFLKIHTSFSPAVTDESTKQEVLSKLKTSSNHYETLLTTSVIRKAFNLNKEIRELFRQVIDDHESMKILIKAYRSICKKYNYLTKPDHTTTDDKVHRRVHPPRQQRTYYRRRPEGNYRRPYNDFGYDNVSEQDYHTKDYVRTDRYPRHDNEHYRPRRDSHDSYHHEYQPTSYRRYNQRYHQEYPPLGNRNTNYRKYKRNPHYEEGDYDSDDIFEQDEQPQGKPRWSFRD